MNTQLHRPHRVRGMVAMIATLVPLAGIVAACSDRANPTAVAPSSASFGKNVSGSTQRILFESTRDGDDEIYSIKPDGTDIIRVTNSAGIDFSGVWSPDGKRIAFVSGRNNPNGEIYVMDADGTNVIRLTNAVGFSRTPSWSKDGKQIVFASNRAAANPAVLRLDDFELYMMNDDGSNVVRLTNDNVFDGEPVFSPDGRQIAFASQRDHPGTSETELYSMEVNGTQVTRLTFENAVIQYPSWDPHSRRLAFSLSNTPVGGIYALNLDDLGLTRLTFAAAAVDEFPSWSADGSQLAFTSTRDGGDSEIYVMNDDGSAQTRLTVNKGEDAFPRWSR